MYNYRIPNSTVRQAVDYANGGGSMMAPTGMFGAEPSTLDNLKAFMEKETMGVKNKFLIAGAAALGVGYYGYTKGWFG